MAHTAGKETVGVMVVVENGEVNKDEYRRFKIKGVGKGQVNDPLNLKEVLGRRLAHSEWPLPKVIVVDGNLIQKNITTKTLTSLGIQVPVVAVVKNKYHRASKMIGPVEIIAKHSNEIILANNEAHRFAVSYHRKLRGRLV